MKPAASPQSVEARLAVLCSAKIEEPCSEAGGVLLAFAYQLESHKAPTAYSAEAWGGLYSPTIVDYLLWKQHGPTLGRHYFHVVFSSL